MRQTAFLIMESLNKYVCNKAIQVYTRVKVCVESAYPFIQGKGA